MMNPRFKYRGDIDGLRAVAVLLVVLFHLDLTAFSGGYIGVDVFFVISGYLISAIIERSWQGERFSFRNFYARRVKRLFPPIFATVLATFVAALIILTPLDLQNFAKSAAAAVVSVSNFVFFFEAGYWDADSSLKPLLHTWSLGVEEQFYLIWPALLVGLLTIQKRISLLWSFALVTIVGAAVCLWMSFINPSAAFYLFPFRIFQFSIGALTLVLARGQRLSSLLSHKGVRELLMFLGIAAIIWSAMAYTEETLFPGFAVFPPTIGACLALMAGGAMLESDSKFSLSGLLANPLSTWLGRVSYSMYLVHWPIIVLYRYATGLELTLWEQGGLSLAILAATLILYYGVEKAFYSRGENKASTEDVPSQKGFLWRTAALALGLIAFGGLAWQQDGFYKEKDEVANIVSQTENQSASIEGASYKKITFLSPQQIRSGKKDRFQLYENACRLTTYFTQEECHRDRPIQVLVFGNSHEIDGYNFMQAGYGNNENINFIVFGSMNECVKSELVDDDWTTTNKECEARKKILENPKFAEKLDIIVYASRYPYYQRKTRTLHIFTQLRELNPKITVVTYGPFIVVDSECHKVINQTKDVRNCAAPDYIRHFGFNGRTTALKEDFKKMESHYIDRISMLCTDPDDAMSCLMQTPDGIPALYDHGHISYEFGIMSGEMYAKTHPNLFEDIMEKGPN